MNFFSNFISVSCPLVYLFVSFLSFSFLSIGFRSIFQFLLVNLFLVPNCLFVYVCLLACLSVSCHLVYHFLVIYLSNFFALLSINSSSLCQFVFYLSIYLELDYVLIVEMGIILNSILKQISFFT